MMVIVLMIIRILTDINENKTIVMIVTNYGLHRNVKFGAE